MTVRIVEQLTICELLAEHGITHKRDIWTDLDGRHSFWKDEGKTMLPRMNVHEACELLAKLRACENIS